MEDDKRNKDDSSDSTDNELNKNKDSENKPENKTEDKPKDPVYKPYDWIQTDLLAKQNYTEIVKQTGEWLESDPRFREHFKDYSEESWKNFLNSYANKKANWIVYGSRNLQWHEDSFFKYRENAETRLWHIQQKKLFNMQCLWRAEKIEIPQISVTKDFEYWEEHIKVCPFLDPITDEEFAMYLAFFDSSNYSEKEHYHDWFDWQDYENFKAEFSSEDSDNDEGASYPEWYFWWDSMMGTTDLINLPDIRGKKEWKYFRDGIDYKNKLNPHVPNTNADKRKYLNYSDPKIIEEFAVKFDDPKLLKYVRALENNCINPRSDSNFDMVLADLSEIDEDIPIEAATDWRIAVENAYFKYIHNKIRDELVDVYMDYISKIKMGISISEDEELTTKDYTLGSANWWKDAILMGRKSHGEPEDFNF